AAPPVGRGRLRAPPAPPAWPRAARRRGRCSCALPFALEARVGHQQLFHADLRIVEDDGHLEIPARPRETLNRPAPEPAVPHALALDVPRRVLGELLRRRARRALGRPRTRRIPAHREPARAAGLLAAGAPARRTRPPVRRPQGRRAPL